MSFPSAHFDLLNAMAALQAPDGVIAFPTDTVWGLGCLITHPEAVERIYTLKGREENKPLILLGIEQQCFTPFVADLPALALDLMEAHWPGALTLVLPRSEKVPDSVTRGLDTIGLRVPNAPLLRELLTMVPEGLLATTSANRSGQPPCETAAEVWAAFPGLGAVLDDPQQRPSGEASTVAGVGSDNRLVIFRQGALVLD
ncbi:MAG: L-threonylcarbamoyladenylate synthase [Candidatus Melainabacteria bacterium]